MLLTTVGTALSTARTKSHLPTILSSQQTWTTRTLTSPILQTSKLDLPRLKKLAKSHKTSKWWDWDSSPRSRKGEPMLTDILSHLPPGFPPNFCFSSIFQIFLGPSFNAIRIQPLASLPGILGFLLPRWEGKPAWELALKLYGHSKCTIPS